MEAANSETKEFCRHCGSEVVEFVNHRFKDDSSFKLCSSPVCVADAFDENWLSNLPYGNDQPILVPLPLKPPQNDFQDILDEMNKTGANIPNEMEENLDLLPVESNFQPIKPIESSSKLSEDSSGIDVQSCSSYSSDSRTRLSSQNAISKLKNELPQKSQLEKRFNDVHWWPTWKNDHNLCWLDVLLTTYVHNTVLRRLLRLEENRRTILHQLIATYDDMILLLNPNLRRISPESDIEGRYELDSSSTEAVVEEQMSNIRFTVLDSIIPDLRNYKIGNAESPVNALKLLMKNSGNIRQFLQIEYMNKTVCQRCGAMDTTTLVRDFVTIPSPNSNLSHKIPTYSRKCPNMKCPNLQANSTIIWKNIPPCFTFLFPNGYNSEKTRIGHLLDGMDFEFESKLYKLKGVIQLVEKKFKGAINHFVTWIKNFESGRWMRCDDLTKTKPNFQSHPPNIYSTEVSMLFFEIADTGPINLKPRSNTTPVSFANPSTVAVPTVALNANGKAKFDFSSLSNFPSYQRKRPISSASPSFSEPLGRKKKRTRDTMSISSGVTVNLVPILNRPKKKDAILLKKTTPECKPCMKPSPTKTLNVNPLTKPTSEKPAEDGLSEEVITRIIDPTQQNGLGDDFDIIRALNDDVLSGFLSES